MQTLIDSLPFNGSKTYIVAVATIIYAACGMLTGHVDVSAGSEMIVTALLGMTVRHAMPAK